MAQDDLIHTLDRDAAWRRLSSVHLGRLATSVGALPVVVPVHYLAYDRQLVFALQPESSLARSIGGGVFAFETSGRDEDLQRWWTVHVRGQASPIGAVEERHDFPLLDASSVVPVVGDALLVSGGEVDSLEHLPLLSDYLSRNL